MAFISKKSYMMLQLNTSQSSCDRRGVQVPLQEFLGLNGCRWELSKSKCCNRVMA